MLQTRARQESFGSITYFPDKDTFVLETNKELLEVLSDKLSSPPSLHYIITLQCNARCPYCYLLPNLLKPQQPEKRLSMEECSLFIDGFSKAGGFRIYMTGGEPTLHPYLSDMIRISHDKGIKSVINTNGIFMPEKVYSAIQSYQSRLSISLDSHIREVHNNARKQKSFDSIVEILSNCSKDKIDTRVISVYQNNQESSWINFGNFLAEIGVKNWFIQGATGQVTNSQPICSLEQKLRKEFPNMRIRVLPAIYDSFIYLLPNGDVASDAWTAERKIYGNVSHEPIADIWGRVTKKTVQDYKGLIQIHHQGGIQ